MGHLGDVGVKNLCKIIGGSVELFEPLVPVSPPHGIARMIIDLSD